MNILIVKLSSLGDVIHAMPAVQDIRVALPQAQIDWVVESAFAPLVRRCEGVRQAIAFGLRRWRQAPLSASTACEWRTFRDALRGESYDAVIDLQGLTKSAVVARAARLVPDGQRYAMANRTEGSSYEAPTRWLSHIAIPMTTRAHAIERSRELCARSLGYELTAPLRFGLHASSDTEPEPAAAACVAFVHGTSRADKCWPEENWVELGQRLIAQQRRIALLHGDDTEHERAQRLAQALGPAAQVWPRQDVGTLTDRLAGCGGVIGVDSGLSHVAVALDLPHVQIYNFDTAWRTGPLASTRQLAVYDTPTPTVDAVWQAWQQVSAR